MHIHKFIYVHIVILKLYTNIPTCFLKYAVSYICIQAIPLKLINTTCAHYSFVCKNWCRYINIYLLQHIHWHIYKYIMGAYVNVYKCLYVFSNNRLSRYRILKAFKKYNHPGFFFLHLIFQPEKLSNPDYI